MTTPRVSLGRTSQGEQKKNLNEVCAAALQQIAVFEDKVRLCKDGYSTETAIAVFGKICRIAGQDGILDSLLKLRKFTEQHSHSSSAAGVGNVQAYLTWYLKNVDYLTELKHNFDTLIYLPLKSAVCDDYVGKALLDDRTILPPQDNGASLGASHSETDARTALMSFVSEFPDISDLYDCSKIEEVSSRLLELSSRWSRLLVASNDIDPDDFSTGSEEPSLRQYSLKLAAVLRLVPDILFKCQRASSLCRQLCEMGLSKHTLDISTRLRKLRNLQKMFMERIAAINRNDENAERQLASEGSDLEILLDREERSNFLASSLHSVKQDEAKLRSAAANLQKEVDDTVELFKTASRDSDFRNKLATDIRLKKKRLLALKQTLAYVEFQRNIVEEDLTLEMNAKPTIIQFTNHLQEQCEKLEQTIEHMHDKKVRLHAALAVISRDIDLAARKN